MGVIEVDSGARWPLAEQEIDLDVTEALVDIADAASAPQASEHGNLIGQEEVHGWENTMVDSLLN